MMLESETLRRRFMETLILTSVLFQPQRVLGLSSLWCHFQVPIFDASALFSYTIQRTFKAKRLL